MKEKNIILTARIMSMLFHTVLSALGRTCGIVSVQLHVAPAFGL